ncbi:MAG: PLP-dependent aminotransferase family protein [Bacteroidota bacterium]
MLPFARLIQLEPASKTAIYLQIVSQLIALIENGQLQAGQRLPGSRKLASILQLNRNTIIAAYDELNAQGWLSQKTGSGTYVSDQIPQPKLQELGVRQGQTLSLPPFEQHLMIPLPQARPSTTYQLNDGLPDIRLAPLKELSREYRRVLTQSAWHHRLEYGDPQGSALLREQLSLYLHASRGLQLDLESIMISRGVIMSLYLLAHTLIKSGDGVLVGETSYNTASMSFAKAGAKLHRIPVDQAGIVVEAIEQICQKHPIKAIYVASHHHHPSTVSLSPRRRIQLLDLARRYNFWIVEDDYDFEFHYSRNPILPIASMGAPERVIYLGSFSKTLAPALRIGYLVAPPVLIRSLCRLRRIVDRQGDQVLEEAVGLMLKEGTIQRHLRKALNVYRSRRDIFCQLLQSELSQEVDFQIPEGGLAVWAHFVERQDLQELVRKAKQRGLHLSPGSYYDADRRPCNKTRLGFAYHNASELAEAVGILREALSA